MKCQMNYKKLEQKNSMMFLRKKRLRLEKLPRQMKSQLRLRERKQTN